MPLGEHLPRARDFLVITGMVWQEVLLASEPVVLLSILQCPGPPPPPKNQPSGLASVVPGARWRNHGVEAQGKLPGGGDIRAQTGRGSRNQLNEGWEHAWQEKQPGAQRNTMEKALGLERSGERLGRSVGV